MPELYTSRGNAAYAPQSISAPLPTEALGGIQFALEKQTEYRKKLLDAQRQTVKIEATSRSRVEAAKVFEEAAKLDDPSAVLPFVNQRIGALAKREIDAVGDEEVKRDLINYFNDFSAGTTISAMRLEAGKTADRMGAAVTQSVNQSVVDAGNTLEDDQTFDEILSGIENTIRSGTGTAYDETRAVEMRQQARRAAFMARFNGLKAADPLTAAKLMRDRGNEFGFDRSDAAALEAQARVEDARAAAQALDDLRDSLSIAVNENDIAGFEAIAMAAPDSLDAKAVISQQRKELQSSVHAARYNHLNDLIMAGDIEVEDAERAIEAGIQRGLKDPDDPLAMHAGDLQSLRNSYANLIRERDELADAAYRFENNRPMDKKQQKHFDRFVNNRTLPAIMQDLGPAATKDQVDIELIRRTWKNGLIPSGFMDEVNAAVTNPQNLRRAAAIRDAYIAQGGASTWDSAFDPTTRSYVGYYSRMIAAGVPDNQAAQRITDIVFKTRPGMEEVLAATQEDDRKAAINFWNDQDAINDAGGYENLGVEVKSLLLDGYIAERQATGDAQLAATHAWEAIKNNVRLSQVFTDKKQLKINPVEMFANSGYSPDDILQEFSVKLIDSLDAGATLTLPDGVSLPAKPLPTEMMLFIPGPVEPRKLISTPQSLRRTHEQAVSAWANENIRLVEHPSKTVIDSDGVEKPVYNAVYQDKLGRVFDLKLEKGGQIIPLEFDARYINSRKKELDEKLMKEAQERKASRFKWFRENFSTSFSTGVSTSVSTSTSESVSWPTERIEAGQKIVADDLRKQMQRALIGLP